MVEPVINEFESFDTTKIPLLYHIETRLQAMEKATVLALQNLDKRLEGMNEFRAQLRDQTSTFATRSELQLYMKSVSKDIKILLESKAKIEGKASQNSVNVALVFATIAALISIISFIIDLIRI